MTAPKGPPKAPQAGDMRQTRIDRWSEQWKEQAKKRQSEKEKADSFISQKDMDEKSGSKVQHQYGYTALVASKKYKKRKGNNGIRYSNKTKRKWLNAMVSNIPRFTAREQIGFAGLSTALDKFKYYTLGACSLGNEEECRTLFNSLQSHNTQLSVANNVGVNTLAGNLWWNMVPDNGKALVKKAKVMLDIRNRSLYPIDVELFWCCPKVDIDTGNTDVSAVAYDSGWQMLQTLQEHMSIYQNENVDSTNWPLQEWPEAKENPYRVKDGGHSEITAVIPDTPAQNLQYDPSAPANAGSVFSFTTSNLVKMGDAEKFNKFFKVKSYKKITLGQGSCEKLFLSAKPFTIDKYGDQRFPLSVKSAVHSTSTPTMVHKKYRGGIFMMRVRANCAELKNTGSNQAWVGFPKCIFDVYIEKKYLVEALPFQGYTNKIMVGLPPSSTAYTGGPLVPDPAAVLNIAGASTISTVAGINPT